MLTENFRLSCNSQYCTGFDGTSSGAFSITANYGTAGWYGTTSYGWYCDVGFDDTAETSNDYKLGDSNAFETTKLTYMTGSVLINAPAIRTVITVYKNETENDVIVKELGLIGKARNYSTSPAINVLVARKVLDIPITVPAGATMAFTYEIDIDFSESLSNS